MPTAWLTASSNLLAAGCDCPQKPEVLLLNFFWNNSVMSHAFISYMGQALSRPPYEFEAILPSAEPCYILAGRSAFDGTTGLVGGCR